MQGHSTEYFHELYGDREDAFVEDTDGNEYNRRGEKQLVEYLDDYHKTKGYMLSFNFNKNKQVCVQEILVGDKVLIEAVV